MITIVLIYFNILYYIFFGSKSIIIYFKQQQTVTYFLAIGSYKLLKRNPQRSQDIIDSALLETHHVRVAQ